MILTYKYTCCAVIPIKFPFCFVYSQFRVTKVMCFITGMDKTVLTSEMDNNIFFKLKIKQLALGS